MIDELSDPLIHMVCNSVDHGLEPPELRETAGKPRAGTVGLQASHRGNSVVITVSDDGRGIDCERIRRKIVAKDLVGPAEAGLLTDRELIPFIWHPGLSTAETITEISGRGVGMDIVKNRIENLSGSVDVRKSPGQGTTFTIRLPLTLAIMSSLLVRIFEETSAIPLDQIDEIVEVRPAPDLPGPGATDDRDPQEDRGPGVAGRPVLLGWQGPSGSNRAAARHRTERHTA
ncbi:MAG: ATP-binding protein [Isosphaeraceae bacterium]